MVPTHFVVNFGKTRHLRFLKAVPSLLNLSLVYSSMCSRSHRVQSVALRSTAWSQRSVVCLTDSCQWRQLTKVTGAVRCELIWACLMWTLSPVISRLLGRRDWSISSLSISPSSLDPRWTVGRPQTVSIGFGLLMESHFGCPADVFHTLNMKSSDKCWMRWRSGRLSGNPVVSLPHRLC